MQGLARRGWMSSFDFLSTVSGGGYAGGWLSAWLFHARLQGGSANDVFTLLAGGERPATRPEPDQLAQVREYSNYLDPKVGLFSVDVWTLISTVARNLVLNWLVLIPLLAAALLVPRLYFALTMLGTQDWVDRDGPAVVVVVAAARRRRPAHGRADLRRLESAERRQSTARSGGVPRLLLRPVLSRDRGLYAVLGVVARARRRAGNAGEPPGAGRLRPFGIWLLVSLASTQRWRPMTWIAGFTSGAVAGLGIWWFATGPFALPLAHGEIFASLAAPIIVGMFAESGALFIGMASGETTDDDREWWSRFGAWMFITIAGWLSASVVVFGGPALVDRALAWLGDSAGSHDVGKLLLTIATGASGAIAARTNRESKSGPGTIPLWRRLVFALAAPTFVVLLLVGLASINLALVQWFDRLGFLPEYAHPAGGGLPEISFLLVLFVLTGLLMGLAIAVNKFSLHGMYRNRLIRAFLGAARSA